MKIEGVWWLVILFIVMVGLYVLAKLKQKYINKPAAKTTKKLIKAQSKKTNNKSLAKLYDSLIKKVTGYEFQLRDNHILVGKNHRKMAMITIDKNKVNAVRKLGNVVVINYDTMPSYERVAQQLTDLTR